MSMSAAHPDFASEQAFLHHAYASLKAMRKKIASQGDAGGDPKASAALKKHRETLLARMEDPQSVCFGRLDLEGGGRFYVGPQGIQDSGGGMIVINWAAKAALPFYEATPENPMALDLRRRFRTERERLLGIADEVFGTGSAVQPTIADILLEELGRERTAEIREIAATIQRDQYRIISRPLGSPTIVQGGPGTGKTVVGLHRAALLLYRHRQELVSSGVLVVGPNRLFMQYIAYVLPSLGETAADQVAIESLAPVRASALDDPLVAQVKGSERMAEVLRKAVVERVRMPTEDVEFQANGVRFSVPHWEVKALVDEFDGRTATYLGARDRFRSTFERRVATAYAAAAAAVLARQPDLGVPLAIDARQIPTFDSVQERMWPAITAAELVRQLLSSEDRLARAGTDVLTETERRLLFRKPVQTIDAVKWTAADGPLVDEVQFLLDGGVRTYGHVVLDEAQDLTPMQLHIGGFELEVPPKLVEGVRTYPAQMTIVA